MAARDSDRNLAARAESIEAEAWADHQLAAPPALREQFAIEVARYGGGVALTAGRGAILGLNRALGLGFEPALTTEILDALIAHYRDARVNRFLLQWSPVAAPDNAPTWFTSRGFRMASRMAKLSRVPAPVSVATDLAITEIGAAEAGAYGDTLVAAWGDPPELASGYRATVGRPRWRHYLAIDGDRPVGGAALFIHAGVAWCGFSATLPSDRGRGAHGALLTRRVTDAAQAGCTLIVCETAEATAERPNQSFENMRRAGFELMYLRPNFLLDLGVAE